MDLPPFLLDQWINGHDKASAPIAYNLASSTGPKWSVAQLRALGAGMSLDDVAIGYAPPEGGAALREAIAGHYGVDPDWVIVTTGASEATLLLACIAARPGANVVMPFPGYPAYKAMALACQLVARIYALRADDAFRQSASNVLAAVDRETVLAFVNTPNNPAGSVMPRAEIVALAGALAEQGVPLVVDDVYHPLYFGTAEATAAGLPNVILMGDMSKAFSLPGLRIGWIIDPDPVRRHRLVDARSYVTISGSPITEALAAHAIHNRDAIFARLRQVCEANLALLAAFMRDNGHCFDWAPPMGGPVTFPRFRDGRDARPFCVEAASRGVLIAPGDCFGMPSHFRLGFGAQAEGFADALAILGDILCAH